MCGVLRIRVVARFLHKLKSTGKRVESRVLCHNITTIYSYFIIPITQMGKLRHEAVR